MTINKNTPPNSDTEKSEALERQNILPQLAKATRLIGQLQDVGIDPILYGSTGVSYYLGQFKPQFGDIDFLVPDILIELEWERTQELLVKLPLYATPCLSLNC